MKVTHALASTYMQPEGAVFMVVTRCGLWVDIERCDEDERATCEKCKGRIRAQTGRLRWSKAKP
jgi:uncharacterized paraquat-inducible protein A